jgi:hypothetical protein
MPEDWPAALQECLNESNFSFNKGDSALRSDMDVGPSKVRNRYTTSIDEVQGSINVTTSEYTTFDNFFKNTLANGTKQFYFNHPITQVQTVFRFTGPYQLVSIGGTNFRISFSWEILP